MTGPEGLHVDYFRNDEDLHYLRIFVNVDREPRVWTLGHQLEELIERYYDEARLFELAEAPSNALCSRLNEVVFDHVNALPRSAMDRHVVSFALGDVWLCETRLNSHEIYAGQRLVATDFYVDPASMLDPSHLDQDVPAWPWAGDAGSAPRRPPAQAAQAADGRHHAAPGRVQASLDPGRFRPGDHSRRRELRDLLGVPRRRRGHHVDVPGAARGVRPSCVMVAHRPFFRGRPGWVRSRASICDLSSTERTTACAGGSM